LEDIGGKLSDEVQQVAAMVEAAAGFEFETKHSLLGAKEKLGLPLDRVALRQIVDAVLATARQTQEENFYLGSSLKQSQEDISGSRSISRPYAQRPSPTLSRVSATDDI